VSEPQGNLRAFKPEFRVEDAVAYLRELADSGRAEGVVIISLERRDGDEQLTHVPAIFGKVLTPQLAYSALILQDVAMRSTEPGRG
jgi:hypothetical protein